MSKLSKEFGISDVALAKTCKKYDIPRPPRGYWARIANGYKDPKTPLPKGDETAIQFDVVANQRNRSRLEKKQQSERERIAKIQPAIEMAENVTHPLAIKLRERLDHVKPNKDGLMKLQRIGLPVVEISEASKDRVVRFLSIVTYALAELGITIGKDESNQTLLFKRDGYGVGFTITQAIIEEKREPTLEEKRSPSWTWDLKFQRLSDELTIILHSPIGVNGRKKWTESKSSSIVDLAPKIAARIDRVLHKFEEDRLAAIQQKKKWEERKRKWKIESDERERQRRILKIKENRTRQLRLASALWNEHIQVLEFISACERRWGDQPTPEQLAWLEWAQDIAKQLSPFDAGYPNGSKHGPLDESTISAEGDCEPEESFLPMPQLLSELKKLNEQRGHGSTFW